MSTERLLPQALQGRPLTGLALAFAAGVLVCRALGPTLTQALLITAALTGAAVLLCLITRFTRWQPLLICGLSLGFFLCAAQLAALDAWPVPPGEQVCVSGRVAGVPVTEDDGSYSLRLRVEQVEGREVACADIYLRGQGPPPLSGSRVTAEGRSLTLRYFADPGAFDYREYLAQQGIAAVISTVYGGWVQVDQAGSALTPAALSQWLRDSFCRALAVYDEQERILVRGVFLGDDSGLDAAVRQALALSGLTHIFAVSGLHVGYLVLLVQALCGPGFRRRRLRFGLTLILLVLYLGLCGWPASMLRAAVMALCLLAADLFMEENDPVSSLSAAALLCLSLRPLWLFSVGFQLSFAAVWALYELGPLLTRLLRLRRGPGRTLAFSLAPVLGTAPLICHYFFYVPWWGWLLSPLVLLAAGVAVVLCLAALFASVLWLPAASFILQGPVWIMSALAGTARLLQSGLPSGYAGALAWPWVLLCYVLLLAAPLLARRLQPSGRPAALCCLAAALALPLLLAGSSGVDRDSPLPHTLAQVTFLDVGQGDCALLRTADGCTVLIDGGGIPGKPGYVGERAVLPCLRSLGLDRLDLVINSHPDTDHTDGLVTVLEELPVGELIYNGAAAAEENEQLLTAAADNGCRLREAWAGDSFSVGGGAELRIVSPRPGESYADGNAASIVLVLEIGETRLLFCGDAPAEVLYQAAEGQDLSCDLIKLPHHGSADGFDPELYQMLGAETAVVSVGAENAYGHPEGAVVEYWQEHGELYRTDAEGAITVYSDGRELAVTTEK